MIGFTARLYGLSRGRARPWHVMLISMQPLARVGTLALGVACGSLGLACQSKTPSPLAASVGAQATEVAVATQGCGAVATFADGKTPSQIRHVATSGSDIRGNGSAAAPFLTITRAAQDITPGTAIYVHAGTHQGGTFLVGLQGREA